MPFKKGHDPNRNMDGRPRKGESLPDLMEQILAEKAGSSEIDIREALCRRLIKLASEGHSWAMKEVFDRTYGKPKQIVDQTTRTVNVNIDGEDAEAVT